MNFKKIGCYIRALPLFIRKCFNPDYFCPHFYKECEKYRSDIFVDMRHKDKFRIANTMQHKDYEVLMKDAVLTGLECKRCGYKTMEYQRSEDIPVIKVR